MSEFEVRVGDQFGRFTVSGVKNGSVTTIKDPKRPGVSSVWMACLLGDPDISFFVEERKAAFAEFDALVESARLRHEALRRKPADAADTVKAVDLADDQDIKEQNKNGSTQLDTVFNLEWNEMDNPRALKLSNNGSGAIPPFEWSVYASQDGEYDLWRITQDLRHMITDLSEAEGELAILQQRVEGGFAGAAGRLGRACQRLDALERQTHSPARFEASVLAVKDGRASSTLGERVDRLERNWVCPSEKETSRLAKWTSRICLGTLVASHLAAGAVCLTWLLT